MSIVPGMTLFYVPSGRRHAQPYEVTVERVGRKWAYLAGNNGRIDIDTLQADGDDYSSPGRCYGSREEWEATTERRQVWDRLRRGMPYGPPESVSTEDLKAIAVRLGVSIEEAPR